MNQKDMMAGVKSKDPKFLKSHMKKGLYLEKIASRIMKKPVNQRT